MSALNNAVRKVQKTENSLLKVQSFFTLHCFRPFYSKLQSTLGMHAMAGLSTG